MTGRGGARDELPAWHQVCVASPYTHTAGAGFYVNATQEPWNRNYNMYDYVTEVSSAVPCRERCVGSRNGWLEVRHLCRRGLGR